MKPFSGIAILHVQTLIFRIPGMGRVCHFPIMIVNVFFQHSGPERKHDISQHFSCMFSPETELLIHFLAQFGSASMVEHQCISKEP